MVYSAKAYAKINLYLNVLGKRDDGYHEIDTLMQSVSLYDDVLVELTDKGVSVECDRNDLSSEENIAALAAKKFLDFANLDIGVKIKIVKRIPVAAGMGGGSADAAATLLLLNKATGKNYPLSKLLPLAKSIGADVPFFLVGGAARAQGIGEVLTKVKNARLYMVLLKEGEKQSTGKMYSFIDNTSIKESGNINDLINALGENNLDGVCDNIFNSFSFCWDFSNMTSRFLPYSPNAVFLSGSGPTVGALFETKRKAQECAKALLNQGFNAFYAETVEKGIEFV